MPRACRTVKSASPWGLGRGTRGPSSLPVPPGRGPVSVREQPVVLGLVADESCQREGQHQHRASDDHGRDAPSDPVMDRVYGPCDCGDQRQTSKPAAEARPSHRHRAPAAEPVVEHGHKRQPAPQTLAQRDHHINGVKHEWGYDGLHEVRQEVKRQVTQEGNVLRGFNLAEEQPADAHDHHSDQHHPPRAQLIDQVALDGAEDAAFDAGEGESEG